MHENGDFILPSENVFCDIRKRSFDKKNKIKYYIKKFINDFKRKSSVELSFQAYERYASEPGFSELFATICCKSATRQSLAEKYILQIGESQGWKKPKSHLRLDEIGEILKSNSKLTGDQLKSIDAINLKHPDVYGYFKHFNGNGGSQTSDIDVDFNELVKRVVLSNKIKLMVIVYTGSYFNELKKNEFQKIINKYGCQEKIVILFDYDDPALLKFRNLNVDEFINKQIFIRPI